MINSITRRRNKNTREIKNKKIKKKKDARAKNTVSDGGTIQKWEYSLISPSRCHSSSFPILHERTYTLTFMLRTAIPYEVFDIIRPLFFFLSFERTREKEDKTASCVGYFWKSRKAKRDKRKGEEQKKGKGQRKKPKGIQRYGRVIRSTWWGSSRGHVDDWVEVYVSVFVYLCVYCVCKKKAH